MAKSFDPVKTNNLDLLRLCLASLVVLGHSRLLLGNPHPSWPFNGAAIAVDMFFIVSGFLIASSYDRSPELLPYLIRRGFRIYPLYAVVVVLQLLGMLAVCPVPVPLAEAIRYLGFNLVFANFMAHDIGGLLAHSVNRGINPSLWTLKVEVGFYLIFPVIWWVVRRYRGWALLTIYAASTAYALYYLHRNNAELAKQLPGALRFFAVGMTLYTYRKWITPRPVIAAIAIIPLYLLALSPLRTALPFVYPIVLGALVYSVAFALPTIAVPRDFSYGLYLVHGPLIQLGIYTGLVTGDLITSLALYGLIFFTAVIAEILIEVPAIKLGRTLSKRVQMVPPRLAEHPLP